MISSVCYISFLISLKRINYKFIATLYQTKIVEFKDTFLGVNSGIQKRSIIFFPNLELLLSLYYPRVQDSCLVMRVKQMIIRSNLSKIKIKILPTCLQLNYLTVLGSTVYKYENSTVCHLVCLGLRGPSQLSPNLELLRFTPFVEVNTLGTRGNSLAKSSWPKAGKTSVRSEVSEASEGPNASSLWWRTQRFRYVRYRFCT